MKKHVLLIGIGVLLLGSCAKTDDLNDPSITETLNNPINNFVWKGLNNTYYWQDQMVNLEDTKDDVTAEYYAYLNGFGDPKDLFNSLLYDKGNTDRFSWFIEDYNEQSASFRGVNDAYGFEFGLATVTQGGTDVIGYVTYVVPGSPADDADVKRGDFFDTFNGVKLTTTNYSVVNAYYNDNSISLGFSNYDNGTFSSNGKTSNLSLRQVIENPIHHSSILTVGSKKVGYLVYNGFKYTFHDELNNAFADFKANGIDELVLDLRYNGGGSVLTSAYLASMIYGNAPSTQDFARLIYNSKNLGDNSSYRFANTANIYNQDGTKISESTISRLTNLSRIYILTTDDTASASEMIINGLKPFMDVITVGTTTYGKNVGSYTVYDSPDFSGSNVNSAHTNAMQPITFKIFNDLDESDYTNGFAPDIEQIEYAVDIKPFGDIDEPLLNKALAHIDGSVAKSFSLKPNIAVESVYSSFDKKQFSKEMYILPIED